MKNNNAKIANRILTSRKSVPGKRGIPGIRNILFNFYAIYFLYEYF